MELVADGGSMLIVMSVSQLNSATVTALCCLAQLSAGCYRAEEQGLVRLEAGLKSAQASCFLGVGRDKLLWDVTAGGQASVGVIIG